MQVAFEPHRVDGFTVTLEGLPRPADNVTSVPAMQADELLPLGAQNGLGLPLLPQTAAVLQGVV